MMATPAFSIQAIPKRSVSMAKNLQPEGSVEGHLQPEPPGGQWIKYLARVLRFVVLLQACNTVSLRWLVAKSPIIVCGHDV